MPIRLEVVSAEVRTVIGKNGANAGKEFKIPEVTAYAHLPGERYPQKVLLGTERGAALPEPGDYILDLERSVYVDQQGRLALSNAPKMLKANEPPKAVAKG